MRSSGEEGAQQGGHRRPLVHEDPDIALWAWASVSASVRAATAPASSSSGPLSASARNAWISMTLPILSSGVGSRGSRSEEPERQDRAACSTWRSRQHKIGRLLFIARLVVCAQRALGCPPCGCRRCRLGPAAAVPAAPGTGLSRSVHGRIGDSYRPQPLRLRAPVASPRGVADPCQCRPRPLARASGDDELAAPARPWLRCWVGGSRARRAGRPPSAMPTYAGAGGRQDGLARGVVAGRVELSLLIGRRRAYPGRPCPHARI